MLAAVLPWIAGGFVLALLLCTARLVLGPGVADRILALDTLYVNTLALLVTLGLWQDSTLYFDLALLIGLFGFIGTVLLSRAVKARKGPP